MIEGYLYDGVAINFYWKSVAGSVVQIRPWRD